MRGPRRHTGEHSGESLGLTCSSADAPPGPPALTAPPFPLQQVKLGSPDYTNCNTEEAVEDFMKRIKCYENSYETLDEVLDRCVETRCRALQL